MKTVLSSLGLVAATLLFLFGVDRYVLANATAHADAPMADTTGAPASSGSEVAMPGSGSGSGSSAAAVQPTSAQLPDPVSSPGAAFDEIKAAKKLGWPVLAFVVLVFLAKLAGRARSVPWLAWLGKGKTAVLVAGTGALAASCYDAAVSGGSVMAIATAALVALAHYMDAGKPA